MAEAHWREHCPRMVRELETHGRLQEALLEAQDQATTEMERLLREFSRQGMSPQQAHDRAWELVREKYILLPPERT
jgi:hypothetical protein